MVQAPQLPPQPSVADALRDGRLRKAQLFVAVPGASNFTYAEVTWTQVSLTGAVRIPWPLPTLAASPLQTASDNIKAGITKVCFYDPAVDRTLRGDGSPL